MLWKCENIYNRIEEQCTISLGCLMQNHEWLSEYLWRRLLSRVEDQRIGMAAACCMLRWQRLVAAALYRCAVLVE